MEAGYLSPYLAAAKKYGAGFGSLLWASPYTQATRFEALLRTCNCSGKTVLDIGCGRADLLTYMIRNERFPHKYIGLEAVPDLIAAAESKVTGVGEIIRGDFVSQPELLDVGADILLFSGSLNTLSEPSFYTALTLAFEYAREAIVFNFLASPYLAATSYLTWHEPDKVLAFCKTLSGKVTFTDNYLKGDATIAIWT